MLGGVEIISRNRDSLRREIAEEARANAGRLELPLHLAVIAGGGADEFVDFLHLDDVALESGNLGDRCDAALAVGKALQLHDHADGGGDLPADRGARSRRAGYWRGWWPSSLRGRCSSPAACRRLPRRGTRRG